MPYSRPGTYVSEITSLGTIVPDTPDVSMAVFVERAAQGPNEPTLISSWNQFVQLYGGFIDTTLLLPYAVWQFFNNGGAQCYIKRVIGAAAIASSKNLVDRAATPQTTLTITAKNAGTWGDNLRVTIVNRSLDRFDMLVYNGVATSEANRVETWLDLSMVTTDARYVVSVVNSITAGSSYISVVDANSASTPPNDRPAAATSQLTGGTNGSAVATGDYTTAISTLDVIDQSLIVCIPGNSTNAVLSSALTYCSARGDAFLVMDTSSALSVASAVAEGAALGENSYGAMYYPWLNSIDAGSAAAGATKLLPPSGAVVGVMVRTDLTEGPYKAPAGLKARISGVVSIERKLSSTELDTLNDAYINAIRHHPVNGITIMGARTLARTAALRYVPVRRSLIYVKDNCKKLSEFAVFETNDSTTWATITSRLSNFLTQYWQAGGLRGQTVQQAFYVVCDETNNTVNTIAAGELHIEVGVAVESPAEFIVLQVGQFDGGATAFEV